MAVRNMGGSWKGNKWISEKGRERARDDEEAFQDALSAHLANKGTIVPASKMQYNTTAFHSTNSDFDRFDEKFIGTATDDGELGRGFYFTTDPKPAYKKTVLMDVKLAINNPMQIAMPSWSSKKRALITEALGLPKTATAAEVTNAAKAKGHDSVILDYSPLQYNHKEILVFSPKQIKITGKTKKS